LPKFLKNSYSIASLVARELIPQSDKLGKDVMGNCLLSSKRLDKEGNEELWKQWLCSLERARVWQDLIPDSSDCSIMFIVNHFPITLTSGKLL